MELTAEINKVFGQEMAKIFMSKIDEEELKTRAKEAYTALISDRDRWGSRKDPELTNLIKSEIVKQLHTYIKELLSEPQSEEYLRGVAKEMVEEARQIAKEAIIRSMAHHMADNVLSVYNSNEKFVYDVMQMMHIYDENKSR